MKPNKQILNEFNKNNSSSNLNNPPLQKIRCAIYTRKSCEDGLELEYNSLDNQYDTCLNFIRSHEADGWVLSTDLNGNSKRYDDGGFSGGTLDRPALKELMQDVQLGLIDKIVIYKLDRISRSNMDYYKLADILQKRNIDIEIATQNFDRSTSIGRFSFGMMLNFAQLEREMASDRIKDKIRRQ
ncbi:MAG TPA: recombinase family protein, partial [Rickettsiales bacterium]|nr:recombinase family protein [Rickettsiales bacterium]